MKININLPRKVYFKYIIFIGFLAMSFYLDGAILNIFEYLGNPFVEAFFKYITYLGNVFIISFILTIILLIAKKKKDIYPLLFTIFLTAIIITLIKLLFSRERPEDIIVSVIHLFNYSFPSGHTAVVFAVLPVLNKIFRRYKLLITSLAFLVLFSRLYLNVHYFSDVVFGAVIGYAIGIIILKYKYHEFFTKPYKFARQFFHAFFGIIIAVLIYFGLITNLILIALIVIGAILSYLCLKGRLPIISWFLKKLERKENLKTFPGKGVITYLIGILIVNLLFEKDIASASIMILALGDPVSHIIGRHYGKTKSIFGKKKFLEGTILGAIAGFAGAVFFVKPVEALIASTIAMIIEAIEIRFGLIDFDDNAIIPLVAGGVIYIIRLIRF